MGIGKIIIGAILIFIGVTSMLRKIPDTLVSGYADEINPFLRFGVVDPTTGSLLFDMMIIAVIIIVGIFLLHLGFKRKKQKVL